ncbi:virulence-associated E family protein [Corynebacterium kutscheri]|nr:virulence-associated E family protein [Corynebacterium kutscheri]
MDQIWAEALFRFKSGDQLHLTGVVAEAVRQEQDAAIESDERAGLVEEYLDTPLPDGWVSMSVRERRAYLSGADGDFTDFASRAGGLKRRFVSNAEIWAECFGRDPVDMKPADSYAIASIMQKMPMWAKTGIVRKVPPYGKQRLYEFEVGEQPPF